MFCSFSTVRFFFSVLEPQKLNLTFKAMLIIIFSLFIIYFVVRNAVFSFDDVILNELCQNIPPGVFLIGKSLDLHCLSLFL